MIHTLKLLLAITVIIMAIIVGYYITIYRPSLSVYYGSVRFDEVISFSFDTTTPHTEYVVVRNSGNTSVSISDWFIKRKGGTQIILGEADVLPDIGVTNSIDTIVLPPSGLVVINSGRSPLGNNFPITICSEYFEQIFTFYPSIQAKCRPVERVFDDASKYLALDEDPLCYPYATSIDACSVPTNYHNKKLSGACVNFIEQELNQKGCTQRYQKSVDFYTGEWRVFLNTTEDFFIPDNVYQLIDNEGRIVDTITL